MNIFEQYGIKEVADVTLYAIELDKHDREVYIPVMYLDTLKVSTLEQTADQTSARGGKGNSELVTWDFNKAINLNLEDALYTPASQSLMWGGKFGVKKPKIRGLWNPRVYPKDKYGRTQYIKRVKMVYSTDGAVPGLYREDQLPEDSSDKKGLQLSCRKVANNFYVGPITNMSALVSDYSVESVTVQPFDQYNEGNWNVHAIDNIKENNVPKYRHDYRDENLEFILQDYYPNVEIYRKSLSISDSSNVADLNDTNEYYFFTFITSELIEAYEAIYADMKVAASNLSAPAADATSSEKDKYNMIMDYVDNKFPVAIKYMKVHENELGVFNEAHLISEIVKDTFLYAVENYFKTDFFAQTTYDLNSCQTAYELYKYVINDGDFKYQNLDDETYMSKLICPRGYDTMEEDSKSNKKLLSIYNWSTISSKVSQSTRPERAEIQIDNYGDFSYYNQPMGVTDVIKIGDNYLDTVIGTSKSYKRKVADTYDNNKEYVMQYYDFYNTVAKKESAFSNPLRVYPEYVVYINPTHQVGDMLSWDEVIESAENITVTNGTDNVSIKMYKGVYGTPSWDPSFAVANETTKNNSAPQNGFFTKHREKGSQKTNHVFFNLTPTNYKYEVKKSSAYKYSNETEALYIKIPQILHTDSSDMSYRLATLQVELLRQKVSSYPYDYISPQFKVTTLSNDAALKKVCLYGNNTSDSLVGCTTAATAHSYVWSNVNLKMMSLEGDQDIYYSENANLRYRTPQNSSIKEIGIAQQGLYMTSTNESYKTQKKVSFTFRCYKKNNNGQFEATELTKSLMGILSDFHKDGVATKIMNQLKQAKKTPFNINSNENLYYGDFTIVNSEDLAIFAANKCNEYVFADKASSYTYPVSTNNGILDSSKAYPTVPISMSIVVKGMTKGDYDWNAINNNEVTSITSLERRFNERESYGYFLKDYSPIVSFYKTVETYSINGNTNLIRVPVGDFYIVSDWNYDGSTAYDYPYAIESGMEDTKVLDRMEKCVATQTFAINTSRNVAMFNYFEVPAYSHSNLVAYVDPKTMKPFEPNSDTFTRKNGDVINGTLRIIKKDSVYYKRTRTVALEHNAVGRTIEVTANQFPGAFRIVGEAYARLRDDGKDRRYQFDIPLAKLSSETNITLQAEGDPTTFSMSFKVLRKGDGKMIRFTQYDVANQEYNGYQSGSTKVVATDVSAITTDNEIANEVNAI